MDLQLRNKLFIVCGATSGFGKAIAEGLINEGARIIAIARREELLKKLYKNKEQATIFPGDITNLSTIDEVYNSVKMEKLSGMVVNAAGPPAKSIDETTIEDWDNAYSQLVRWKIDLTKKFLPLLKGRHDSRILYIESASVKQPIENLVLSTSMRLAVVGFVKTLSQEHSNSGTTFNIMAPGFHETSAVERLIRKKSEQNHISFEEAKSNMVENLPMKRAGNPDDFASLALWILSPWSGYINGQVFPVDGGTLRGTL